MLVSALSYLTDQKWKQSVTDECIYKLLYPYNDIYYSCNGYGVSFGYDDNGLK